MCKRGYVLLKRVKQYSANYSNTNNNFVIQNIDASADINNKYYQSICVVKNILQRGKPTLMSTYLQKQIGSIQSSPEFKKHKVLISKDINIWERLIKGSSNSLYNPAQYFYQKILDNILGEECKFVKNLLLPEVLISDITQENKKEFKNQQVDFYLPQAYLVIEIDGSQHKELNQQTLDIKRDNYLKEHGIKTVRLTTEELKSKSFETIKKELREYISKHKVLTLYKDAFNSTYNLSNPIFESTIIMRYQIFILELLKYNKISFENKTWKFELFDNEENTERLFKLAIQDLFIWFACLFKLQDIKFIKPKLEIKKNQNLEQFSKDQNVKIDFSLLKRYSDINQRYPNIYFIRTDYIDTYKQFKSCNSATLNSYTTKQVDHYQVEIANLIKYNFNDKKTKYTKNKILKYLLWNLFLQTDETLDFKSFEFREGQLEIIKNVLSRKDTIGLLPTGSGKSICYQLAGILQPAPSFIISPIISLMNDQIAELNNFYFSRTESISSNKDAIEKFEILEDFSNKKYFFIFISPERFQDKKFRTKLKKLPKIAYAVVDEAHCLSEWGHDFRTSYLTLVNTIRTHCNVDISLIALTATASLSVLKDLKLAFNITNDENVKTPINYAREELEFFVIDATNKTFEILQKKIKNIIDLNENFATIVFTPYASENSKFGCTKISNDLNNKFPNERIEYYHGQIKDDNKKEEIQNSFKNNEFNFLVATKSFGMGVNKGNVKYTFHYGIPGSLEALYQEAGRAGRAKNLFIKNKAKCYILFSKEIDKTQLEKVWDLNTSRKELLKLSESKNLLNQDVKRQLYFLRDNFTPIDKQLQEIKNIYYELSSSKSKNINCRRLQKNKFYKTDINYIEKILYRLYQLGIITDWTKDYNSENLEIDFKDNVKIENIRLACQQQISKYDKDFLFENIETNDEYKYYNSIMHENIPEFDKYVKILLEWSFDKFIGYRRQSLKNVYEACDKYILEISNGVDEKLVSAKFKKNIESYFTVNEATHKLVYLSEHPFDLRKAFELFYIYDSSNKITEKLKNDDGIIELKNILMRLLEEYPNNMALNLVSGLTRYLLEEFKDPDGQIRFERALNQLSKIENESQKQAIIINILKIGKIQQSDKNRVLLAKCIFKYFEKSKYIVITNKFLNDSYTNYSLMSYANKSINNIIENILK